MQLTDNQNAHNVKSVLKETASKIAPLWSLENFVAVNPYLGLAEHPFNTAMEQLKETADAEPTLPIAFYLKALDEGRMTKADLKSALSHNDLGVSATPDEFLASLSLEQTDSEPKVKTISDLASELNGKDWKRFMIDRISQWAAAYFDHNQAVWKTTHKEDSIFQAWKREAEVDLSTELMGLSGFRKLVKGLSDDYIEASELILNKLNISENTLKTYLHRLAMSMSGWVGYCSRIDFEAGLQGNNESAATSEFISILLSWEYCLLELVDQDMLKSAWDDNKSMHSLSTEFDGARNEVLTAQLILQDAFDRANQRTIIQKLAENNVEKSKPKAPLTQAVFCIDVRSELLRRNLEALDPGIDTMGFAGFFGFPINYVPLGHSHGINHCPALITTSHTIKETVGTSENDKMTIASRRLKHAVKRAWYAFKSGAISCFGFVSPIGLSYLPKLFTNSFGLTRPQPHPDVAGLSKEQRKSKNINLTPEKQDSILYGIPKEDRLKMAESALRGMSLTENFAKTILIVGHGSSTVNNPHASGLDCGACGGQSGEANAKVAAAVLNDIEVRNGLKLNGIEIPENTMFVAAKHDTTTDEVSFFNTENLPESHQAEIEQLEYTFSMAAKASRAERGERMNIDMAKMDDQVLQRSKDWSQVRPEYGLAGCSSFIVAPRKRTAGLNLGGKSFLHSYDWKKDKQFNVLEAIMTAPMVVTTWINLQYYASTVDNKVYGSGNKTLHNVVGGLGVFEGFGGDLRVGLPLQSIFDGKKYQHQPQRLNVVIEAPVDEMSKILEKHKSIRDLCDNNWIYLFAMNEEGKVAYKYIGNLEWEVV